MFVRTVIYDGFVSWKRGVDKADSWMARRCVNFVIQGSGHKKAWWRRQQRPPSGMLSFRYAPDERVLLEAVVACIMGERWGL